VGGLVVAGLGACLYRDRADAGLICLRRKARLLSMRSACLVLAHSLCRFYLMRVLHIGAHVTWQQVGGLRL
jgi:hypothetical protein